MNESFTEVREIDLLAYADGLLDHDLHRRRMVELYLRERPEEAARLRAYAVQNEEIRRHYADVAAEPVPDALIALLDAPERKRRRGLARRVAAVAALVVVGTTSGWLAGSFTPPTDTDLAAFVERVATGYRPVTDASATTAAGEPPPLGWLSEQVAVNIEVPDLTEFGLQPVERRRLPNADDSRTVAIEYADGADRRLVLFIGTRWQDRVPDVQVVEQDGLRIAYWQDGPFVYGLVAEDGGAPLLSMAETIARRQEGGIATMPNGAPVMSDTRPLGISDPAALSSDDPLPARLQ